MSDIPGTPYDAQEPMDYEEETGPGSSSNAPMSVYSNPLNGDGEEEAMELDEGPREDTVTVSVLSNCATNDLCSRSNVSEPIDMPAHKKFRRAEITDMPVSSTSRINELIDELVANLYDSPASSTSNVPDPINSSVSVPQPLDERVSNESSVAAEIGTSLSNGSSVPKPNETTGSSVSSVPEVVAESVGGVRDQQATSNNNVDGAASTSTSSHPSDANSSTSNEDSTSFPPLDLVELLQTVYRYEFLRGKRVEKLSMKERADLETAIKSGDRRVRTSMDAETKTLFAHDNSVDMVNDFLTLLPPLLMHYRYLLCLFAVVQPVKMRTSAVFEGFTGTFQLELTTELKKRRETVLKLKKLSIIQLPKFRFTLHALFEKAEEIVRKHRSSLISEFSNLYNMRKNRIPGF